MKFIVAIIVFILNLAASGYSTTTSLYYSRNAVQSAYPQQSINLLTVLRNNGFTTFVDLIKKAGLEETFSQDRTFIVLAPTNEAFAAIDPATLAAILYDVNLLRDILSYHLVLFLQPYSLASAVFVELPIITAASTPMRFNAYRRKGLSYENERIVTANGVPLLRAIPAGQSIIYEINGVLNPQDVSANNTIINFLRNNGEFSIFLSVYETLGLIEFNSVARPRTVFIPTDAAFESLPPGVLDSIFADREKLVNLVLNIHTASGTFYTAGLTDGPLTVLAGITLDVDESASGVTVENAEIVGPDITVFEGVVHVVNSVIRVGPTSITRQY